MSLQSVYGAMYINTAVVRVGFLKVILLAHDTLDLRSIHRLLLIEGGRLHGRSDALAARPHTAHV